MEELEDLKEDVKCKALLGFEESEEAHRGVIWSGLLRWPAKEDIGREIENELKPCVHDYQKPKDAENGQA